MSKKVSMAVIRRLPKYHRYLADLLDKEVYRISSKELSEIIGFTASQIRQDLNNFGGFGQQGYGYNVEELYNELSKILGLDKSYNTIILGAGNLGQALANYSVGIKIQDLEVMDVEKMEEFIKKEDITIAVICTPKEKAQESANKLIEYGIKGIWNFAPMDITVPENIKVEEVNLSESLYVLSYMLNDGLM